MYNPRLVSSVTGHLRTLPPFFNTGIWLGSFIPATYQPNNQIYVHYPSSSMLESDWAHSSQQHISQNITFTFITPLLQFWNLIGLIHPSNISAIISHLRTLPPFFNAGIWLGSIIPATYQPKITLMYITPLLQCWNLVGLIHPSNISAKNHTYVHYPPSSMLESGWAHSSQQHISQNPSVSVSTA